MHDKDRTGEDDRAYHRHRHFQIPPRCIPPRRRGCQFAEPRRRCKRRRANEDRRRLTPFTAASMRPSHGTGGGPPLGCHAPIVAGKMPWVGAATASAHGACAGRKGSAAPSTSGSPPATQFAPVSGFGRSARLHSALGNPWRSWVHGAQVTFLRPNRPISSTHHQHPEAKTVTQRMPRPLRGVAMPNPTWVLSGRRIFWRWPGDPIQTRCAC